MSNAWQREQKRLAREARERPQATITTRDPGLVASLGGDPKIPVPITPPKPAKRKATKKAKKVTRRAKA